jgi:hypothetical protein
MLEENSTSAEDSRARLPDVNTAVHERKPKFSFYVACAVCLVVRGLVYILFLSLVLPYGRYQNTLPAICGCRWHSACDVRGIRSCCYFRQTSGPIEVSAPGFSIKGAAGQVLFWLFVFLAIVHAIEVLWPLKSAG